jgi:hypothetical protein
MEGFALEAIREHPVVYASGIAYDWVRLFAKPHRSVAVCAADTGPHLCTGGRSDGDAVGPFSNTPTSGSRVLKEWLARYVDAAYPVLSVLGPLAALGVVVLWRGSPSRRESPALALMVGVVLYFSVLAVTFNTVEDRYRLPADAFLMVLACAGISRATTLRDRLSPTANHRDLNSAV